SPWDGKDWEILMADAETPLERRLSLALMRGTTGHPDILRFNAGSVLMAEGDSDESLMLLLDGIVSVSVAGTQVATLGPGAVIGERAGLEAGRRTATITATTACTVAVTGADVLDLSDRTEL